MRITSSGTPSARRQQALINNVGYFAENMPLAATNGVSFALTGTVYFQAIGLISGDIVANITTKCQTAGLGQTLVKVALFKKDGTQLAVSADVKASYLSTGTITSPMAVAYTVPTDDLYYVAFLGVGGTQPVLYRGFSGGNASAAVGSGSIVSGVQTGQADMPSPATITATSAALYYWMAIS